MKVRTVIRLSDNVLYSLVERRCPFCGSEFLTPTFGGRRSCGACPVL